jgi:hypothetical protein
MDALSNRTIATMQYFKDSLVTRLAMKLEIPITPNTTRDGLVKSVLNKASDYFSEKELHYISLRVLPQDGKLRTGVELEAQLNLSRNSISNTISVALKRPLKAQAEDTIATTSIFDTEPYLDKYTFNEWNNYYWNSIATDDRISKLHGSVSKLPELYRHVLQLRYGFYDGTPWKLQEIGDKIGRTRECARQIEKKALAQLRINIKKIKIAEIIKKEPEKPFRHIKIKNAPEIMAIVASIRKERAKWSFELQSMATKIREKRENKLKHLISLMSPEAKLRLSRIVKDILS